MNSGMIRRDCLKLATAVAAIALPSATNVRWATAQTPTSLEAGHRNKLILLLRKTGTRGGLYAQVGAILGLYDRGNNIATSRMSMRKDEKILTFGRIGMSDRELYYFGIQPDAKVLHTYFFLTNYEFKLVARGAELVDDKAEALPPERAATIFAEVLKHWITHLETL